MRRADITLHLPELQATTSLCNGTHRTFSRRQTDRSGIAEKSTPSRRSARGSYPISTLRITCATG